MPRVTPRKSTTSGALATMRSTSSPGCAVTITDAVGALEQPVERLRDEAEVGQLGHEVVVVGHVGAVVAQQPDDLQAGRLAQVAHAGLVGHADHARSASP